MTQAPEAPARSRAQIERTFRKDRWWQSPRITAAGLTIWVLSATVRVFTGHWFFVPKCHHLTPFYSPWVSSECVPGLSAPGPVVAGDPAGHPARDRVAGVRARLPGDVRLLPAGVLPGLLAFPGRVRVARAARGLHRRDQVPPDRAEPAPLLLPWSP
jgi:hypothetical protein